MQETLRMVPLFSELSRDELNKLACISRVKRYPKDSILFYEGETPIHMLILKSGGIKIFKTNIKGTEIFLHSFAPISLVAELPNFENIPYPASARFSEDSEVILINYKEVEKDFLRDPDISFKIIHSLSQKLRILSGVIHQEVALSVEGKVAKILLENSDYFGNLKDNKIAAMINIRPETLSRTLAKFRKDGWIKQDDTGRVVYIDEKSLHRIVV